MPNAEGRIQDAETLRASTPQVFVFCILRFSF
jgi:hypothetical protein